MIVDTHVHMYNPFRSEGAPWPDRQNVLLYRPTLPVHLKAQAVPEGVTGAIVVEASEWVEDNQWILDMAEDEPFLLGLVGRLEPGDEHFVRDLERFAIEPRFVGIRFWGKYFADISADGFVEKMRLLAEKGLVLDVNFPRDDARGFFAVLEQVADLKVVIEHVGQVPVNGAQPPDLWLENMRRVAAHPQTAMKVSALMENCAVQPAPAELDYYRPALDAMWELFGEDRLFYGSNWPVCERAGTYARCIDMVRRYFGERGGVEKFFWKNSQVLYGWEAR